GEAGIGKTSLLQEFADGAWPTARVLVGACEDLLTPRPLGPFRDMARDAGGLAGLAGDDRDAFLDALLAEMAFTQRPAVVIVEDAHWADAASLDIVRYLARRIERLSALLVVSYRDEELRDDHPFARMVAALAGPSVLRIELEGLSDEAVAELAAAAGLDPGPVVAAVGGNPFYLTEVLAAPGAAVPPSVRHAVRARFASLPASCRSSLERLAVVPSGAEPWLVRSLVEDPAALEPAERRGMVVSAQGRVRFRHELARRAVELSLPSSRRMDHHRRALAALAVGGAEPSRLVHHAVAAADDQAVAAADDQAVARNAAAAARDAAGSSAHREAAAFARLALEHEALFDRLEVARLHGLAALALYARNQFGDAAEHADRAVELWDTAGSAPLELGEALLISARMSTLRADPAAARAKALRALGILEAHPPSRALALCYSTLCSQDTMQARFDTALGWCKRALEVAERVGSLDVVSHALGYRGLSKVSLGDDAGLADLERALEVADRLGHGDYVTVAAHNLAVILIRIGRVREARQALEVGERAAREHALDTALFRIEAQQCHVLLIEGSWDEAERRLRRLLRRSEDPGANLVNPLAFLGRILARRGDPEAAGLIERAWRLASATGEDQKMAVAAGARIEHAWIEGDDDRVRAIGGELLELAVRAQHRYLRGEVLRYLRRVGEPVAPFDGCLAPFADGITGDWAAAAAGWERIGNPYHQALELTEAPDLEAALRGLGMLDRLGAVATASLVRRRLRRGGARGIPGGRGRPPGPTRAS
ncbi:MAG TPA: AAA family ATPase, partial [Actinomycetota bacterium]|nr:AAA family ATPase [Actinomycetota bacterium]